MNTCTHEDVATVEVGGPLDDGPTLIGYLCRDCDGPLLPLWWCCDDCETVERQRLCDPVPTRLLSRPCRRHQERR